MVDSATIGVLGIQGAISEHISMMKRIIEETDTNDRVLIVRKEYDLECVDGLIIPGGESTTISRFLISNKLFDIIQKRVKDETLAVMGTCAGCVLIGSDMVDSIKDVVVLSLMNTKVERNAFGRQKESFEVPLSIKGFDSVFPAVFIRAPVILDCWGGCRPLAVVDDQIVMAQQENVLGLSFHPELTDDTRIHRYFFDIVNTMIQRT